MTDPVVTHIKTAMREAAAKRREFDAEYRRLERALSILDPKPVEGKQKKKGSYTKRYTREQAEAMAYEYLDGKGGAAAFVDVYRACDLPQTSLRQAVVSSDRIELHPGENGRPVLLTITDRETRVRVGEGVEPGRRR